MPYPIVLTITPQKKTHYYYNTLFMVNYWIITERVVRRTDGPEHVTNEGARLMQEAT